MLQISDGRIEFFPVLQAQCLETEEDETAKQLEALRSMVTSVLERFKEEVLGALCVLERANCIGFLRSMSVYCALRSRSRRGGKRRC